MNKRVLYIGNNTSKKTNYGSSILLVSKLLEGEGYQMKIVSSQKNILLRLVDMCFSVIKYRNKIDYILIDTFSSLNFFSALFTSQIARLFKIKYLPVLRGGNLPYRIHKNPYLSGLIFNNSHINVAPSNYLKTEFEKKNYKIILIPNVLEIDAYPYLERKKLEPKILWVRAFKALYNPMLAIDVFCLVQKEFKDVKLCMIGPEKDDTFSTYVYPSKSREYIMIGSSSTMSNEFRFLSSKNPLGSFKLIQKRERGLEYRPYHFGDMFYISTNIDDSTNFKLVRTLISSPSKSNWKDVISHRDGVLIEEVDFFKNFMVLAERINGLLKIRIKSWDGNEDYYIGLQSEFDFENETYDASIGSNPEYDTDILRYNYTSLTTPYSVIDLNVVTQKEEIKKQQEILGGDFDSKNYTSERLFATAHDGKKIPISLVRHVDTQFNKNTPILQYGYGSYGSTIDPSFSSVRLSLLDRGFVFAIAHIRGSQYLGRSWYEDGRMLYKKNTFKDFVSSSKFLIENNYTSKDHLYAEGGSAGGLLMGAVMNMAPEIYNGIISAVPFVDVVTTMLDESIPLTSGEYDEWGNPNDKEYYDYMKSYSPYDNLQSVAYPNTLVTTGLHDSQVQYWEPAKWVAKLRTYHQGNNIILLHTNMDTGHSGASGRFEPLKEIAMEYAFLFMLEGIK